MPSVRDIRRRIRSVDNTGKVTNAMSLIAASKMRRAQNAVLQGRPYSEKILDVIAHLAAQPADDVTVTQPLLQVRPVERIAVLVISPDRGLCGGMHANLNRRVGQFMLDQAVPVQVVAVGRKGRDFMVRSGSDLRAVFTDLGETPSLLDTLPISDMLVDTYAEADADEVYVAYTRFNSTLSQTPVVERLLPITPSELTGRRACRLHLRTGQPVGAPQSAAPIRRDAGLPRHVGVHRQRAVGPNGCHAQRHRQRQAA